MQAPAPAFPGCRWPSLAEDLRITLVDSVAKKVGFLKHAIAQLALAPRVQAVQLTLKGDPAAEGLQPFDTAVSRASQTRAAGPRSRARTCDRAER